MSIGRRAFPLALVLVLAVVWSCQDVDDDNSPVGITGGVETADPGVGATRGTLLANGEDQVAITALVTDRSGRPLGRVPVQFTTNRGSLDAAFEVTDFDGRALVILTSEQSAVDLGAQICATIPEEVDTSFTSPIFKRRGEEIAVEDLVLPGADAMIGVAVGKGDDGEVILSPAQNTSCVDVQMLGISVSAEAASVRIPADGVRTTTVTAVVRETTSGIPVAQQSVQFGASAGTLEGDNQTNTNGQAVVTLTSSTTPGQETLVAFSAGQSDTVVVEFTPLLFSLSTSTSILPADGGQSADIVATVLSEDRNPLPGVAVQFSTTLGAIASPKLTDASGRAIAQLTGEGVGGTATVVGRFAAVSSDTVTVDLSETFRPAAIVVRANPATIVADGLSSATIAATVLDSIGGPVPDGTPVTFTILSGTGTVFSQSTTEGGVAEAALTSGTAVGTTTVRAATGGVSGTASVEYVAGDAAEITVSTNPTSLVGNGIEIAAVTATVRDRNGNLVGGRTVSFESTRGSLDPTSAVTSVGGLATTRYRSDIGAGPVRIDATVGEARGSFTLQQTSGAPAEIDIVSVDPQEIGVRGTDIEQKATMVFVVKSADGVPVGPDAPVTVQFELVAKTNGGAGSGEFLTPLSDVTDENGMVRTVLNSGTLAGVTETVARITSVTPNIRSRSARVSINSDLPVKRNLTVAATQKNIPGLCFFNVEDEIVALVYDRFQNPVPTGTAVYFTSQYAGIEASDTTDALGRASVQLISANQLPPIWSGSGPSGFPFGFVEVYAQTADSGGAQIRDSTYVLFSGCTILENVAPTTFAITDGDCETFSFNLWDLNENPLAEGTTITVTASAGTAIGDTDVELPDTQAQGPGLTDFSFSLCDDDIGDFDPPVTVTIKILVESPNNNASYLIVGTLD